MAYTNNIPFPTQQVSASQSQIEGNFNAIDTGSTAAAGAFGFSRNHVTMTDGTNGGLHYRVDYYQVQSTAPTISGFTSSLYPRTSNTISELFYKNGTSESQMTNSGLAASSGEGMLPGGLQIRCGTGSLVNVASTTVSYTAFPTNTIAVLLTDISNYTTLQTSTPNASASSFTVTRPTSTGTASFSWLAIGY